MLDGIDIPEPPNPRENPGCFILWLLLVGVIIFIVVVGLKCTM
jgi:hypothetical protein